jgi:hypothetical protein
MLNEARANGTLDSESFVGIDFVFFAGEALARGVAPIEITPATAIVSKIRKLICPPPGS